MLEKSDLRYYDYSELSREGDLSGFSPDSVAKFYRKDAITMPTTSKYKLIGYPLSHSLSPFIHERLFQLSRKNSIYDLYSISQQDFDANIDSLLENDGFNVTIPYKMQIMDHLDKIDEKAKLYNSVNTVNCGQENVGYNTDCYGFLHGIHSMGTSLKDGPVLLLGAGGSAHMIATEAVLAGAKLTIAVRAQSLHKGEQLRAQLMNVNAAAYIRVVDISQVSGSYNLIVNATPVGMFPHVNECPISEEVVKSANYVYDLIYNPIQTNLLKLAEENGKGWANGLSMLVWQAVYAHKIWYQAEFRTEDIEQLIRDAEQAILHHFSSKTSDRSSKLS